MQAALIAEITGGGYGKRMDGAFEKDGLPVVLGGAPARWRLAGRQAF